MNGTICGTRDELLYMASVGIFLLKQVRKLLMLLNPFYFFSFGLVLGLWGVFVWLVFFLEKGINFDETFPYRIKCIWKWKFCICQTNCCFDLVYFKVHLRTDIVFPFCSHLVFMRCNKLEFHLFSLGLWRYLVCTEIINKEAGRTDTCVAWLESGWRSHISWILVLLLFVFCFHLASSCFQVVSHFPWFFLFTWLLGIMLAFFLSCLMLNYGKCKWGV